MCEEFGQVIEKFDLRSLIHPESWELPTLRSLGCIGIMETWSYSLLDARGRKLTSSELNGEALSLAIPQSDSIVSKRSAFA